MGRLVQLDFVPQPLPPPAAPAIVEPPTGASALPQDPPVQAPVPAAPASGTLRIPPPPALPNVVDESKPAPVAPAPRKGKLVPVDYEPQPIGSYDVNSDSAIPRGIKTGWTGSGGAIGAAFSMPRLATLSEADQRKELLLMGTQKADPKNAHLKVDGIQDITGFGDTATFLGESVGQLIGSWGAAAAYGGVPGAVVGAGVGAVGGAAAGGVGALPGAVAGGVAGFSYGTMGSFGVMGVGGMLQDLTSDKAVQAGLKDGSISPKEILGWATGAGAAIGALDAVPAGKFFARMGGKEVSKDAVKMLIRKAALKGAVKGIAEEGGTEGLQQAISEITQAGVGGDINLSERTLSVLNNAAVGAIGGAGPGVVGHVVENARIAQPPKADDQPDVSAPAQPEGTPAPVTAAAGQPTPGGTGVTAAPPPASAAGQVTPTAVPSGTVDPTVAAALAPAQQAPAAPVNAPPVQPDAFPLPVLDVAAEDATGDAEVDTLAADQRAERMKALWKDRVEADKAKEAAADRTTPQVVTTVSSDAAAALAAATADVKPATGETIGTGQALGQTPQVGATPPVQPPGPPMEAVAPATAETMVPQEQGPVAAAAPSPSPVLAPAPAPVPAAAPPVVSELIKRETIAPDQLPIAAEFGTTAPQRPGRLVPMDVPPVPLTSPIAPAPGAKGAAFKRKKLVTTVIAKKEAATAAPVQEAAVGQPVPENAPAAAPASAPGRFHSDVSSQVRIALRNSTASDLPEFNETIEAATQDDLASNPRDQQSPREYIEKAGQRVAEEVKRRLEAAQTALDDQRIKDEEAASVGKEKVYEEKKLREGKAQERERAGKTGKSAEGIIGESEKATKLAVEKNAAKPEAERSPELTQWGALHEEQINLSKKPADMAKSRARRVEIAAEKKALQEARAEKTREAERAKGGLDERASDMKGRIQDIIAKVPLPAMAGTDSAQLQSARANLRAFHSAMQAMLKASGKTLPQVMDRKNYSTEENLAIYAAKLIARSSDTKGQGATEWVMARIFQEANDLDSLYGISTTDTLRGGESEGVALTKKKSTSSSGSVDENKDDAEEPGTGELNPEPDSMQFRTGRKGGAAGRQERDFRRGLRDTLYEEDNNPRPMTLNLKGIGRVTVDATTSRASGILGEVSRMLVGVEHGFQAIIRNTLIRHLIQLVGDVDVHHISNADMIKIAGSSDKVDGPVLGVYFDLKDQARADDVRPRVFINDEIASQAEYAHTVIHELVHAATSQAIRHGIRGTDKIIKSMRLGLEKELLRKYTPAQVTDLGIKYAFTDDFEFVAEAFSNQAFQDELAQLVLPAQLRLEIDMLGRGRPATWWNAFTAAVSNAIGLVRGQAGLTYMEQVLKLQPQIFRSSSQQYTAARDKIYGRPPPGFPRAMVDGPADIHMLFREQQFTGEAVRDKFEKIVSNGFTHNGRVMREAFSTTAGMIGRATKYFGPDSPFEWLAKLHLKKSTLQDNYRKSLYGKPEDRTSIKLEMAQRILKHDQREEYNKLQDFLAEASAAEVDPTVPLSNAVNKHVSKAGIRDEQQRAEHKRLEVVWNALSPEARALGRQTINHFRQSAVVETRKHIAHTVRMALLAYHKPLPAGKTVEDAVDWVLSGGAERAAPVDPANLKTGERTPDDVAWHAALGKTAETLAEVRGKRLVSGIYVPFGRRGKFFLSVTEKMPATPAGAILDGKNRFVFNNEKDFKAFANSHVGPLGFATEWIDPSTGKKVSHTEPQAVRNLIAIVQNKRVEMSDDRHGVKKRAAQLQTEGHTVDMVGETEKSLNKHVEQLAPAQIKRLLKNLEQTMPGTNTIGLEGMKNAILDAQIRAMNTPGSLSTRLKRNKVLGYDQLDLANSTRDYNRALANHFANTDLAYDVATADAALTKLINEGDRSRDFDKGSVTRENQEAMASELRARMVNTRAESNHGFARVMNSVRDITVLKHLFSPHYSIMNLTQPLMMTYPTLAGMFPQGAVWREMMAAYRIGGTASSLGAGFSETWAAARNLNPLALAKQTLGDSDEYWHNLVAKEADGALLQDVFSGTDGVRDLGFGASSGIEAPSIAEEDKNTFERALGRMVTMAKAIPQRIESINRYTTAIAAYRLAVRSGMDHAAAKRTAVLVVEKSQGGYGAANNPAFFSKPFLGAALQFRKFSLAYGQLFYGSMANMFAGSTPEARKQGRRTLGRLILTTTAFAGLAGSPLVEIARMLANVLFMLGGSDNDWEDDEAGIQKWLSELVGSVTGKNSGASISEALIRGAPRLAGLDMSNALGADNLFMFGQPRSMDSDGAKVWLFDAFAGASGSMLWDSGKAALDGDIVGAIPWPKIIDNMIKAHGLYTKGTVSKKTGEQYAPPTSLLEAGYKLMGFQPASSARQFEGGSGTKSKQDREMRDERRTLMGRWSSADPAERARIFREEVRAWNKEHRKPDERIDMGDLYRSQRSRAKRRKELAAED